jgi:tetratricopeptide (TPR) repeat protein
MRFLLMALLMLAPAVAAEDAPIKWLDLDDAQAQAEESGHLILVKVVHTLDKQFAALDGAALWEAGEVIQLVNKEFVPVSMYLDHEEALQTEYDVHAAPAILVLDADAKKLIHTERPAFADIAAFVKWLNATGPAVEQLRTLEQKFEESDAKSPRYADALAAAYDKLGRAADAAGVCQRYAKTLATDQPDCGTAWLRAATLYLKAGKLEQAQSAIDSAGEVIGDDDSLRVELRVAKASLLAKQKKYDEANEAFTALYDEMSKAGDARAFDASLNILNTALEKDSKKKAYRKAHSAHHKRCGELAGALKDDPRVYEIRYSGAVSANEAGDGKGALKEMGKLAQETADDPWVKRARVVSREWGK